LPRLLETGGEYAAERLDEAAERADTERRHLLHYRELVRTPRERRVGMSGSGARGRGVVLETDPKAA
jgi:hypothetical protein